MGGELRLSTPVQRVELRQWSDGAAHLVHTDGGEPERFDLVVSNADVFHTYATLYRDQRAAARVRRRLDRMAWSMSLFLIYFGTNRRYPGLAHHTVVFGPRYEGLLRDIFHGARLPDDFSLYLHAPTVTDPSLAPPGCECFYVLSPVPNLLQAPVDWDRVGPAYADRILASLESFLPGLRSHIVTQRLFSPRDFERQLQARHGAAFSLAPTLLQSAWFRPHNRDPHIPGLYLVGAGTHPGAGVPGVVNSGKATAAVVLSDLRHRLRRPAPTAVPVGLRAPALAREAAP
jgi:phytoene desaturase